MTSLTQTPDQIERKIEETRSKIDQNLDALQNKVSPGELIDEAMGYVKGSGGELAEGITRTIRENPVPSALIGAGIGLFLLSRASNGSRKAIENRTSPEQAGADGTDQGDSLAARAENTRDQAVDAASSTVDTLEEKTSEIADSAKTKTTAVKERAAEYVDSGRERVREAASASSRFAGEHPFVLAALGLAAGAGVAALMRSSDKENKLLGAKSDRVKRLVKESAQEQGEKVKVAAEAATRRAKEETENRGFTGEQTKVKAKDLLQEGRDIADAAGTAAKSEFTEQREAKNVENKKVKPSPDASAEKTSPNARSDEAARPHKKSAPSRRKSRTSAN